MSTPLGRVRGLGAAKAGVSHWITQRLTAIALAPLSLWFVISVLSVLGSPDPFRVADWLASPWHALCMTLFLVAAFWHARLGLQVVIEDYVHAPWLKYPLLVSNTLFCFLATGMGLLAVLKLHVLDIVSGF